MNSTSKILTTIGIVLGVIGVIFGGLLVGLLATGVNNLDIINKVATDTGKTVEFVKNALNLCIVIFGVALGVHALLLVGAIILRVKGNGKAGTNIALLAIGILSVNVFYIIASIFGFARANEVEQQE